MFYLATVYLLSWAPANTNLSRGDVLLAIAVGAAADVIAIPAVATFADRHGRRTMMVVGNIVTALAAYPIFLAMSTGTVWGAMLAMMLAFPIAHSIVYATSSGFVAHLFPPKVRYTGSSVAYQVGGLISSAPAPVISTLLYAQFGTWAAVAGYLVVANLIAAAFCALADKDES